MSSSPSRPSPAVFQAGENVTLTCTNSDTNVNTFSWTSSLSSSLSSSVISAVFLHGANSGNHICTSGGSSVTYTLSVQGKV